MLFGHLAAASSVSCVQRAARWVSFSCCHSPTCTHNTGAFPLKKDELAPSVTNPLTCVGERSPLGEWFPQGRDCFYLVHHYTPDPAPRPNIKWLWTSIHLMSEILLVRTNHFWRRCLGMSFPDHRYLFSFSTGSIWSSNWEPCVWHCFFTRVLFHTFFIPSSRQRLSLVFLGEKIRLRELNGLAKLSELESAQLYLEPLL